MDMTKLFLVSRPTISRNSKMFSSVNNFLYDEEIKSIECFYECNTKVGAKGIPHRYILRGSVCIEMKKPSFAMLNIPFFYEVATPFFNYTIFSEKTKVPFYKPHFKSPFLKRKLIGSLLLITKLPNTTFY